MSGASDISETLCERWYISIRSKSSSANSRNFISRFTSLASDDKSYRQCGESAGPAIFVGLLHSGYLLALSKWFSIVITTAVIQNLVRILQNFNVTPNNENGPSWDLNRFGRNLSVISSSFLRGTNHVIYLGLDQTTLRDQSPLNTTWQRTDRQDQLRRSIPFRCKSLSGTNGKN